MWKTLWPLISILSFVCNSAAIAPAAELPPQIQAGEHRLVLNGSGTRTKILLQLYVAGLYLKHLNSNPNEIVAANEPMAIRIKITSGFVSQKSLIDSLEEGFKSSAGGDTRKIRAQIEKFRDCFKEVVSKDDTFDMVYVPEHGVHVNKNGELMGVIAGTEFKQALFGIWLSDKPVDSTLKQALLTSSTVR